MHGPNTHNLYDINLRYDTTTILLRDDDKTKYNNPFYTETNTHAFEIEINQIKYQNRNQNNTQTAKYNEETTCCSKIIRNLDIIVLCAVACVGIVIIVLLSRGDI